VSTFSTAVANSCKSCARELAADALVCKQCHTLVHAAELQQISAGAQMFEKDGEPQKAIEAWQRALTLIPDDVEQKKWVRDKIRNLEAAASVATKKQSAWAKKLGPLAPIAVFLAKGKFLLTLFKLKSLLSLATFVAFYWTLYGMKFGIGFAALILVHEMGHYIDIKRRGLPAEMPMFLPGFGAYVKWAAMGVSVATQAAVSLAGPIAGLIGAAVCALLWWQTGNGLWAALASSTAILNALNLTPVWVLDGGKAIAALDKTERIVILAASLILCFVLDEKIFLLVAAGATYRLFTKDLPVQPSRSTLAYFLAVMAGLGLILYLLPAHAIGPR
jgi:Zn-dependent protease